MLNVVLVAGFFFVFRYFFKLSKYFALDIFNTNNVGIINSRKTYVDVGDQKSGYFQNNVYGSKKTEFSMIHSNHLD